MRIPLRRMVHAAVSNILRLQVGEHEDRLWLHGRCGVRLRSLRIRLRPPRLALAQEVDGKFFLLLLVRFPVRGGTEFLVLQLMQGADLLSAVKAFHAVSFIE